MNKEAMDRFNELLKTDPNALTGADIEFLKARRDYLTEEQKAVLDKLPEQLEEASETKDAQWTKDNNPQVNTAESAAGVTGAYTSDEEDAPKEGTSDQSDNNSGTGEEGMENPNPSTPETVDYNSMKIEDLKELLQSRKIEFDSSAKKADLVSLLQDADK